MDIMTALIVAASGLVIVFLMLALLWASIIVVSKIMTKIAPVKTAAPVAAPAPAAAPVAAPAAAPAAPAVFAPAVKTELIDVDDKTAACIMAIVSHETGISLSELVFKKIKAL